MSDEWEMTVKVRLRNVMDGESVDVLRGIIADEGGPMQVICGWCDSDDLEIVSLERAAPGKSEVEK
jgi:hypothetical protein